MIIVWHEHHIVPKRLGGTDAKSNVLKCNIAMHAFMHWLRYKEHGHVQDLKAWKGLRGMIPVAEVIKAKQREHNIDLLAKGKHPFQNFTAEERSRNGSLGARSLSNEVVVRAGRAGGKKTASIEGHLARAGKIGGKIGGKRTAELGKAGTQTKSTCPVCGYTGQTRAMGRWHFDNCKGPDYVPRRVHP